MKDYSDIINLPTPTSKKHKRMPMENRARQFAPFDALTGYKASIFESGRLTTKRHILNNDERLELSSKLSFIKENIKNGYIYTFIYFIPDELKDGGIYQKITDRVKKLNENDKQITLSNNLKINIKDIYKIESIVFKNIDN